MNKAFELILKKIEEKRNKYQRLADSSNFDGWDEEDIKYNAKAEMCEELKEIVQEVPEAYKKDIIYNLAEMYAQNMFVYGVDITKVWETATQQSYALEQAYIRGRKNERDKFNELRKEYKSGWIPCSERLPENDKNEYIVQKTNGFIDILGFTKDAYKLDRYDFAEYKSKKKQLFYDYVSEYGYIECECVAWQPLPEPFKESEKNE